MTIARYFSPRLRALILSDTMPEWLKRHNRKSYIIACVLSKPEWADTEAMQALRREAQRLTLETGEQYVLDHHPYPLTHPLVCGLTVHQNLRVVPWRVNASKGNKWNPDQLELFPIAE
jgi:hypothetical protein